MTSTAGAEAELGVEGSSQGASSQGVSSRGVSSLGIGIPGIIHEGRVVQAPNLAGWDRDTDVAATLGELGITSTLTGRTATGTGTDCTVVASGRGSVHRFCGKHVPLGEVLARTAMRALGDAIRNRA